MTITPEEAIKWHEQRAAEAHAGLSCGSENSEYRAADKVSEMHRMAARAIAVLAAGEPVACECTKIEQLERENAELRSERASARSQVRREALEEAAALASRMLVFADTTSSADKEIPAAIRRLAEQEAPEAAAIRKLEA